MAAVTQQQNHTRDTEDNDMNVQSITRPGAAAPGKKKKIIPYTTQYGVITLPLDRLSVDFSRLFHSFRSLNRKEPQATVQTPTCCVRTIIFCSLKQIYKLPHFCPRLQLLTLSIQQFLTRLHYCTMVVIFVERKFTSVNQVFASISLQYNIAR